ncbi:MAG: hypothetical protein K6E10_01425, partial [Eubacterium sp.]|nr:hypothetical protein [Eubacterium sp.]
MSGKKKITIGIAIGLAFVMAVGIAVFFVGQIFSPKRKLMNAIKNTYSEEALSKANLLERYTGIQSLADVLANSGGKVEAELDIENPDTNQGIGLSVENISDKNKKVSSTQAELSSDGDMVLDADIKSDDLYYYAKVDGVTDGYLKFEKDDFQNKFGNTVLSQALNNIETPQQGQFPQQGSQGQFPQQGSQGQFPQQGSQGQFPQQGSQGQFPQIPQLPNTSEVLQLVQGFMKEADVKAAGNEEIEINDDSLECEKYEVVISEEAADKILNMMSQARNGEAESKQAPDIEKDIKLNVYVSDGYVRAFDGEIALSGQESQIFKVKCKNYGSESITSAMNWDIEIANEGGSLGNISFDINQKRDGDSLLFDMNVGSTGQRSLTASLTQTIGLDDKSIDGKLSFVAGDTDIGIDYSGQINSLKKGQYMTLDMDQVNVEKSGDQIFEISGKIGLSSDTEGLEKFTEGQNALDVFAASDEELSQAAGISSGDFDKKVQEVMSALAILKGNSGQKTPYSEFNQENPYGQYGQQDPFSSYGGMNPFMGPGGINPYSQYGQEDPFSSYGGMNPFMGPGGINPYSQYGYGDGSENEYGEYDEYGQYEENPFYYFDDSDEEYEYY